MIFDTMRIIDWFGQLAFDLKKKIVNGDGKSKKFTTEP